MPVNRTSPGTVLSIPASVPGDLITDLQAASQIADPLYEQNWYNSSIWDDNVWTYRTYFALDPALLRSLRPLASPSSPLSLPSSLLLLVFDGVKMGADVFVNGQPVGRVTDQYRRYGFELDPTRHRLQLGGGAGAGSGGAVNNTLEVVFDSSIDVGGRFMACTGGWDWAPCVRAGAVGSLRACVRGWGSID
jgi:beta-mannosidase